MNQIPQQKIFLNDVIHHKYGIPEIQQDKSPQFEETDAAVNGKR